MKAVVQRVARATVLHDGDCIAQISRGIVVYIGIDRGEPEQSKGWLIDQMRAVVGDGDQLLCLSQFTLFAQIKGRKPSFHRAEETARAEAYFTALVGEMKDALDCPVRRGLFGKYLNIKLIGTGMETFMIERKVDSL